MILDIIRLCLFVFFMGFIFIMAAVTFGLVFFGLLFVIGFFVAAIVA